MARTEGLSSANFIDIFNEFFILPSRIQENYSSGCHCTHIQGVRDNLLSNDDHLHYHNNFSHSYAFRVMQLYTKDG
jgi:hypothetical protein